MTYLPIKRALLSVSNKTDILKFAKELVALGIEIISTGGTSQLLAKENIPHRQVEEITGLAPMLDGRVKTLHPTIHGGILGLRDKHAAEASSHHLEWIDLVVVNFYPFVTATKDKTMSFAEAVEFIDVGGPTMLRAAAKNFAWVAAVIDPNDYQFIIENLRVNKGLSLADRQKLACKAFAYTSYYDECIQQFFQEKAVVGNDDLILHLQKKANLRYGENPHQKAFAYQFKEQNQGILSATIMQGKPLSFNNIIDSEAAYCCVNEFKDPACAIIKHANPCGVATGASLQTAYLRAFAADRQSAFGGVVALNRICDEKTAADITAVFTEVVLAPDYTPEALNLFAKKPNLRVLALPHFTQEDWEMKLITGGLLCQEKDKQALTRADLKVVTQTTPSEEDITTMLFAWRALKHIKSNAILIAQNQATQGIGAGQVSRIDAVEMALFKAGTQLQNSILASDAFFPFRDSIDRIAKTGIRAVIQPGGAIRDEEVIAACNEYKIAMVFTGIRCFKH